MTANVASPSPLTSSGAPASTVASGRFTPLDPVKVLQQYIWVLLAVLILGVAIGAVLYVGLYKFSPEYTSEAQLLVTGSLQEPYEQPSMAGGLKQQRLDVLSAFIKNQISLIKSDEVIGGALLDPKVQDTRWYRNNAGSDAKTSARDALNQAISANQILGSTLIRLTIQGKEAKDLSVLLGAVVDSYLAKFRARNDTDTAAIRQVFSGEAAKAQSEYDLVQNQLRNYREENNLATLEAQNDEANITYNDLASRASALVVALQTAREQLRALEAAQKEGRILQPSADDLSVVEADPSVNLRDERLRNLREQREVLLHRMGDDHRVVMQIDQLIDATLGERVREVNRLLRERQAVALDQARKAVGQYESQLVGLQPALAESRAKVRDLTEKLQTYRTIEMRAKAALDRKTKAEALLADMSLTGRRPDNAGVSRQVNPTDAKLTFPTIGGVVVSTAVLVLALAIAVIFMKELLDQRIKSPTDIMLIPHARVLGNVPQADMDPLGPSDVESVVRRDPTGLMAEAFRQTRTAILSAAERGGHRVFAIVGPQPASGVSSMVNNLALSMAFDGRKVLAIDANFRKPALHRLFGVGNGLGLADVLTSNVGFDQAVMHVSDPNVDVLTAGDLSKAAPELLEGRAFQNLLNDCRARYDVILIDTPPALLTSEATMLSKHVDAAVLVVRAGRDKRGMVARMLRQMNQEQAEMLGIVLNAVRPTKGGYFSKNYDMFYQYRQSAQRASMDEERALAAKSQDDRTEA